MNSGTADVPIDPSELIRLLAEKVTDAAVEQAGGNVNDYAPWTKLIFSVLRELATERGGVPIFTCNGRSEFMLDFVWLQRDDYGSQIKTALAVEVESWMTILLFAIGPDRFRRKTLQHIYLQIVE